MAVGAVCFPAPSIHLSGPPSRVIRELTLPARLLRPESNRGFVAAFSGVVFSIFCCFNSSSARWIMALMPAA